MKIIGCVSKHLHSPTGIEYVRNNLIDAQYEISLLNLRLDKAGTFMDTLFTMETEAVRLEALLAGSNECGSLQRKILLELPAAELYEIEAIIDPDLLKEVHTILKWRVCHAKLLASLSSAAVERESCKKAMYDIAVEKKSRVSLYLLLCEEVRKSIYVMCRGDVADMVEFIVTHRLWMNAN